MLRPSGILFLFFLTLVAAAICSWDWLHSDGDSNSETLRNIGLVVAAIIALPLALWRSTIAERQACAAHRQSEIAMQNLLNERFQKGAEMLGHPDLGSVRIGGIHALARLASEHPETFHLPVMQLFAAFVVDRTRTEVAKRETSADSAPSEDKEPIKSAGAAHSADEEDHVGVGHQTERESRSAEYYGPFFAADRRVGPVPFLAKDVEEVMRMISQRDDRQIALERKNDFRMNLADASLPGFIFHKADFSNFDFTKADLRRVRGWDARLSNAIFPGADLSGANMHGADFRDADMRRINLTAARLDGANLRNANLGLVDLVGQNLWKGARFPSKLIGALLMGADLRGADLGHADMRGASLGGAKLDKTDLRQANLSGADIRAASLRDAALSRADLSNANLGGAGADLSGADLTGANLADANLGSTKLTGAKLEDADISGVNFIHDWMSGLPSPASGLTQEQLDEAKANPCRPPILDGLVDPETNKPLVWGGRTV